jgi:hypothetical protein
MTLARRRAREPSCAATSPGADLLQELGDGGRVPAVLPDLRAELGRDPGDLGPHGDPVVAGAAAPFDGRPAVGPVEGDVAEVLGDPLGPAGLQQHRRPALQAQEGGGEVLDLEGRAVLDLGDAEAGAAAAAGAELRVGRGGGRGDLGLAEQVEGHVEHVDADVHHRAAAGALGLGEPGAHPGDALATDPAGLGVVDLAEHAGVDDRLQRRDVAALAVVEGHLEHAPGPSGGLDHGGGRLARLGHRLLGHDVDAGLEGGDRHGGVEEGRGGDRDDVELRLGEHLLPVLVAAGHLVPLAELRQEVLLHGGERDEVDGGVLGVGGDVLLAGPAQADHPGAEAAGGVLGCC